MKQSGGYIWVYSEPGKGTTFKIYMPHVTAEEVAAVEQPAAVVSAPRRLRGKQSLWWRTK